MCADVRASLRALLGGYHDYAVGTSRTIDGRRRSVLQHFHGLDVGRIDVVHIAINQWEAVYHDERVGTCVDRSRAAHAYGGLSARLRIGEHSHTGALSLQCLERVGGHHRRYGIRFQRRYGAGKVTLLHRSVTYHHHIFQVVAVFLHLDGHAGGCFHFLRLKSHVAQHQRCAGRNIQCEVAVHVGHRTLFVVSFHHNAHTNKGFARPGV